MELYLLRTNVELDSLWRGHCVLEHQGQGPKGETLDNQISLTGDGTFSEASRDLISPAVLPVGPVVSPSS